MRGGANVGRLSHHRRRSSQLLHPSPDIFSWMTGDKQTKLCTPTRICDIMHIAHSLREKFLQYSFKSHYLSVRIWNLVPYLSANATDDGTEMSGVSKRQETIDNSKIHIQPKLSKINNHYRNNIRPHLNIEKKRSSFNYVCKGSDLLNYLYISVLMKSLDLRQQQIEIRLNEHLPQ